MKLSRIKVAGEQRVRKALRSQDWTHRPWVRYRGEVEVRFLRPDDEIGKGLLAYGVAIPSKMSYTLMAAHGPNWETVGLTPLPIRSERCPCR